MLHAVATPHGIIHVFESHIGIESFCLRIALIHEMEVLLSELANKDVKNHLLGWYGSHCWASKAVAKIQEWNETKLHYEPVGEPVDMKQAITPEVKAQCEALGKAMAEKLLAE